LAPVVELAEEPFRPKSTRDPGADALQPQQHLDPSWRRVSGALYREQGIPLRLDRVDLVGQQLQNLDLTQRQCLQVRRQGPPVTGTQFLQPLAPVLAARLVAGGRAAYQASFTETAVVRRYLDFFAEVAG